jgi:hypothetical protein
MKDREFRNSATNRQPATNMKKSLILGLLSLAATVTPSFGQGTIFLDNYFTSGPSVTYGAGTPLPAGWTMGFYYAVGNQTGVISSDPTGTALPETLGGGLALAIGSGSTAAFYTSSFNTPGQAFASAFFSVPGTAFAGGDTITVMVIAYTGLTYAGASARGHSTAFTMATSAGNSSGPNSIGDFMPGFNVPVPEPSVFAIASLAASALLFFRSKNQSTKDKPL